MANILTMTDDAMGRAQVSVSEVYADSNGTYNFTAVLWVLDLDTDILNDDVLWCEQVQDYLQNEGYADQQVSAQCERLYNKWIQEHAQ
jgi:outer membrane protein assembly factor BamA